MSFELISTRCGEAEWGKQGYEARAVDDRERVEEKRRKGQERWTEELHDGTKTFANLLLPSPTIGTALCMQFSVQLDGSLVHKARCRCVFNSLAIFTLQC